MNNPTINWILLERHLAGETSPSEQGEVAQWIADNPDNRVLFDSVQTMWQQSRALPRRYEASEAWKTFSKEMGEEQLAANIKLHTNLPAASSRQRHTWILRAAAALIVILGGVTAWKIFSPSNSSPNAGLFREVATARGQRATIRLADGTKVDLGVASKLRYAPEFGSHSRDVYLEGEAYFEATHDAHLPFIVHTSHATVRDIGTKFGVKAYAETPEVDVVVAEGAVALKAAKSLKPIVDSLILTQADLGRLDSHGQITAQHHVDVSAKLSWREGRLVFTDAPLREVVRELNRWYNTDIQLGDTTLAERRYTASIQEETLPQLLNLLGAALDIRVDQHGQTALLYPKHHTQ